MKVPSDHREERVSISMPPEGADTMFPDSNPRLIHLTWSATQEQDDDMAENEQRRRTRSLEPRRSLGTLNSESMLGEQQDSPKMRRSKTMAARPSVDGSIERSTVVWDEISKARRSVEYSEQLSDQLNKMLEALDGPRSPETSPVKPPQTPVDDVSNFIASDFGGTECMTRPFPSPQLITFVTQK